jgi:hypothetical protein
MLLHFLDKLLSLIIGLEVELEDEEENADVISLVDADVKYT